MANVVEEFGITMDIVPLDMLDDANSNLSHVQKELLSWYHSIDYVGFKWLQELMSLYKYDGDDETQDPIIQTKQNFS
eukprot:2188820-Ditylum_brightwellii.AAC.1